MDTERPRGPGTVVNDVHSRLNETVVADVVGADSLEAIRRAVARSRTDGLPIAVSGGRHAMGGQQFCSGGRLLDLRPHARVHDLDRERGVVDVDAGIQWPALLSFLHGAQPADAPAWGIRQKQTGADRLTLGGALAANAHGRGLSLEPIVGDVESLTLVDAAGDVIECSREQNGDLFGLVVGGYGLFGVVASVRLRLARRQVLERVVEIGQVDGLVAAFDARIADGYLYGDFQFAIDPDDRAFLQQGVFSCYRPVEGRSDVPPGQRALSADQWRRLIHLAHVDKTRAWELYSAHYLATSGQHYHSDRHQLSEYVDDYHRWIDGLTHASVPASEMITELYVPRERLADFMREAAAGFRSSGADVVYGTVRLIERDDVTFLPWARGRWACVVFNLHTVHSAAGLDAAKRAFQHLIDLAIDRGGSYYLTYHRWARPDQVAACYPELGDFLAAKRSLDPEGRFQSDWYRHHAALLG